MRKLLLAVALVALVAAPAFAAVQNVKVSGNITTTSILDKNIVAGGSDSDDRGSDILAQTELNVEADLTDNVSTKIGLLNERLWGNTTTDTNSGTSIDLETAYVTMKELLYSPLTVTVGRQPLVYGNSLIVASNNTNAALGGTYNTFSKKGNFDAIKAVLGYEPVTVDLFASRINNNNTVGNGATGDCTVGECVQFSNDNQNLYGAVASSKLGDKMSTVVEGYLFARMNDNTFNKTTGRKSEATYVPGLRMSINPAEGLGVQLEGAYQLGKVWNTLESANQNRDALALQGMVSFAVPGMKDLSPVLSAEYKYLSAAKANAGKIGKDWDPMFEHQDNGRIFDQLGLGDTNLSMVKVGAQVTPLKDLTTGLSWYGLWLAQKVNPDLKSKYQGSEVDADITYAYTEDVKFGLSAGLFMTGKTFSSDTNKNATQVLTSVSVAF